MEHTTLLVTVLAVFNGLIPSAAALKCFQCETATNKNCTYLMDLYMSVKPQECADNETLSLNGFSHSCLKILTTNYYGKIVNHQVVRRCIWQRENQDPCAMEAILRPYAGPRTAHQSCTLCSDKDGCNSTSALEYFSKLVVLGAVGALLSSAFLSAH